MLLLSFKIALGKNPSFLNVSISSLCACCERQVNSACDCQKNCSKPEAFYLEFSLVLMNGWDMTIFLLFLVQSLWSHELRNCVSLSWRETFRKDSNVGPLCCAEDCHMKPALLDRKVLMNVTANVELILVMCSCCHLHELCSCFSFLSRGWN